MSLMKPRTNPWLNLERRYPRMPLGCCHGYCCGFQEMWISLSGHQATDPTFIRDALGPVGMRIVRKLHLSNTFRRRSLGLRDSYNGAVKMNASISACGRLWRRSKRTTQLFHSFMERQAKIFQEENIVILYLSIFTIHVYYI